MEKKDRTVTVAVVIGVVALLLGCCLGAMAGAMGGYLIGHQASSRSTERIDLNVPEPQNLPDLENVEGALIQEVIADSPAGRAGLQAGDIITEIDGTPIDAIHRLGDVIAQYQPGERVELKVWRLGNIVTLRATLGENPQNAGQPYLGVYYADFPVQGDESQPDD